MMRVLGIDPGSLNTGLGVVEAARDELRMVACECIRNAAGSAVPPRLAGIFRGVRRMIELHRPDAVAIEQVFVANNARSALVLGQAGGGAICAAVVGGCEVTEYSARQIKRAVVGAGAADKRQVQHMVRVLLGLRATPSADEADALACAICHIHNAQAAKIQAAQAQAAETHAAKTHAMRRVRRAAAS